MKPEQVIKKLKQMGDPSELEGRARYGIDVKNALGVRMPAVRQLARECGKDHQLALALWETGIPEARIMAALVDEPGKVTKGQMEKWASAFKSWDVCDQCCLNLFRKTPFAFEKAAQWAEREKEFVKRAGFALMATLAVHEKKEPDKTFDGFLMLIIKHSDDERNFVKKAVNWALRQIGKRNPVMNAKALEVAEKIAKIDSKAARWIAKDAIRELTDQKILKRLEKK